MRQTTIFEFMGTPCDFVQQIYDFNKQAGLLEKGYDDFLESSFQIEEALEGISCSGQGGGLPTLARILNDNVDYSTPIEPTHKSVARGIVEAAYYSNASDVDRLDKACDAVVFAIGSMAKLGLTTSQIIEAMNIVTEANLQKLSNIKIDSSGKLLKDSNFVGPETKLQALLDSNK